MAWTQASNSQNVTIMYFLNMLEYLLLLTSFPAVKSSISSKDMAALMTKANPQAKGGKFLLQDISN